MYLKRRWNFGGGFSFYKVERETECFYFVRINERCVERVSKKKIQTFSEWSVPTEEDFKKYKIRCLVGKLESLIKATDFEKWSEEKLKEIILIFEEEKKC